MKCRDHGREPCTVSRCQVLALCAAEEPYGGNAWQEWMLRSGYTDAFLHDASEHDIPAQIADRLVAWMRWRGDVACMACGGTGKIRRDHCPLCRGTGARPGWHRLDERVTQEQRIRALVGTCPVCRGSGWHPVYGPVQHELQADGGYQPTPEGIAFRALHLPCDYDGIDWATVLVFLDWLADHGWTLQEVHEWRPTADPLPTAPQHARRRI